MKSIRLRNIISASVCTIGLLTMSSILPTLAQSNSTQGGTMQQSPMQGGSMQQSPMQGGNRSTLLNSADRDFIVRAAQSDMTEIQTSQLALKQSQNPRVRQFAQQMIQHHTRSSNKLKPIASKKGVALPKSLGADNQALLTQLTKLSGTRFDQAYMSGQAKAHAKTQALYQNELKQGQDAEVQAFAREGLPVVTAHLSMAQSMMAGR